MGAIAGQIATAGVQAGLNILSDAIASKRQLKLNKSLAAYQFGQNRQLLQEQLAYNSPKAQMDRFREAGLNPNMVLSQGSAGNQSAPLTFPEIKPADATYGAQLGSMVMDQFLKVRQGELLKTQIDLNTVKKDEVTVNKDLKKAQADLVRANPYLNKDYVDSIVLQLQSAAALKKQEADFMLKNGSWMYETGRNEWEVVVYQNGIRKMEKELELLEQKYNLSKLDQKIKGEILQSKDFANTISEIQMKWLKDGEINADIIKQFIFLLISRFK